MINGPLGLLRTPTFDDPEKNRISMVLYPIVVTTLVLACVLPPFQLHPAIAPNLTAVLVLDAVLFGISFPSLWMIRRGHVQMAAFTFSLALWTFVTLATLFFGGVGSATLMTYLVVTVLAGFFWGSRALVGFSAFSSLVALIMVWIEYQGNLPEPLSPTTPMNSWFTLTISLVLITRLLTLSMRSTDQAVAEAQRSADAHRSSEARFRGLLEASPDAVFIHSDAEILYANRAFAELVGVVEPDQIRGRNALQILQLGEEGEAFDQTRSILNAESEARLAPDRWCRVDGSTVPVEVSTRTLMYLDREAVQVVARDVSEREELEGQLRQAQKMEAVGQFSGGIAHDFNNLLTVIGGNNEILLRQLEPDSSEHENASEIERATGRATELIRQILAFSRRQVLQPVVLDLNTSVRETDAMLSRLIGEDIELQTQLDPELDAVRVDPVQVEQVLLNLAINARDAMPRGGQIRIETNNVTFAQEKPVHAGSLPPGRYVQLIFSDTGAGMDSDTQFHMFDPFFTTKGRSHGTGLGLATVYGIVKQSGGAIAVRSEKGAGTVIEICLPRSDERLTPVATTPRGVQTGTETILIAEDDGSVRRLTKTILEDAGYAVLEARTGVDALVFAEAHSQEISILVTDVIMPDMGGAELAEKIKLSHPETKVLFVSGYADDSLGHHGILSTETAFLGKPFTAEDLTDRVRQMLDRE